MTSTPKNSRSGDPVPNPVTGPGPGAARAESPPAPSAATPGKPAPARGTASGARRIPPRGGTGSGHERTGGEAAHPVVTPPVPGSAPDGRAPVPGAERGQAEPSSRVPVSPAATAAAALGGSRGTLKPASGPSPGQPDADSGQAGPSPAAARAAAARATSGGSGIPSRRGRRGGGAGPERGPGPARSSSSADQGSAEEEQGPARGGRPRAPLAGQVPGAATGRSSAAAPGLEPLRGQAWRDAVNAAKGKQAAARRNRRGRPAVSAPRAGAVQLRPAKEPPGRGGAS
jgi:hypothetical protein